MTTRPEFDASALAREPNASEVREYVRRLKAEGRYPAATANAPVVYGILIAVQVVVGAGLIVAGLLFVLFFRIPAMGGVSLVLGVLVWVWAVFNLFRLPRTGKDAAGWLRLERFATANGLAFVPRVTRPALPGLVFQQGWGRASNDVLRSTSGRFVEYANYCYRTGNNNNNVLHRWGYVAIKLNRPLPNIVLDSKSNDGLFGSTLPESFRSHQRLSLEGDFDRHFTLYCLAGYEADALYLFTPDIMARFIDKAAPLDVEIVDDWLLLYAPVALSTLDERMWRWLFSLTDALEQKLEQWGRWHDDRADARGTAAVSAESPAQQPGVRQAVAPQTVSAGQVSPEGRRLRRRG
ncbi:hypothetical protein [Humibacter ginsenosidimutans]|uniref:DUF3137 domain-containing protein n=1 Tax=Humibacter ginsenosidimutans TaxID=2599293 RepID=A0A5B8M4W8_9MICO|nr:hypothetical protein [Humibacter ginsenosidimutans]QDZ15271.1 hypothetical protein FPZ11_11330 [Humibacter ginsenosidimutans]